MLGQVDGGGGGATAGAVIVALALYFIPTIIAMVRKVPNVGSVIVINLLLGWTIIGWIVALAMAAGSTQPRVALQVTPTAGSAAVPSSPGPTFTESGARYLFGYTLDPPAYGIWDRQSPGPPIERFPYSEHGKSEGLERYRVLESASSPPSRPDQS